MADDKKNPDEYEYPSEDYYKGEEYRPESDEELESAHHPHRHSFLSRRLYLLIGFLFAIGAVYLFVAYHNARKNAELSSPIPVATTGAASIPSTATSPIQAEQVPTTPVAPPAETAAIQNLTAQNQANQQSIANLQGQVQQLQGQITEMSTAVTNLNNQLQIIVNEIRAIATDRQLRGRNINLVSTGKRYILKALVPGRAWLQSQDGQTTTVSLGDRLPGYGIIQMINTAQGIVTTSSGELIQYGPRDN